MEAIDALARPAAEREHPRHAGRAAAWRRPRRRSRRRLRRPQPDRRAPRRRRRYRRRCIVDPGRRLFPWHQPAASFSPATCRASARSRAASRCRAARATRCAHFVATVLADTEDTWTAILQGGGQGLSEADADALLRQRAVGLRRGERCDRAVLLPGRPERLHRPRLLQRAAHPLRRAGRLRRGLCARARGRPPRAERARHSAGRARAGRRGSARPRRMRFRSAPSCRPTALPASGRTIPRRRASSIRATSTRR